jgi:hypothetical protein
MYIIDCTTWIMHPYFRSTKLKKRKSWAPQVLAVILLTWVVDDGEGCRKETKEGGVGVQLHSGAPEGRPRKGWLRNVDWHVLASTVDRERMPTSPALIPGGTAEVSSRTPEMPYAPDCLVEVFFSFVIPFYLQSVPVRLANGVRTYAVACRRVLRGAPLGSRPLVAFGNEPYRPELQIRQLH